MTDEMHDALGLTETIRLNTDGTAWVNPKAPMSPKTRAAVQALATFASSLVLAHREMRGKIIDAISPAPEYSDYSDGEAE